MVQREGRAAIDFDRVECDVGGVAGAAVVDWCGEGVIAGGAVGRGEGCGWWGEEEEEGEEEN